MAYPGFQREGCLRSGPIQKVGGPLQVRYTKSGPGGGHFRSDIRKVGGGGGGGGGPFRFRSDTFGHTYVTQAENFTYIGCIA